MPASDPPPSPTAAERALEEFIEGCLELREGAVLDARGRALAASSSRDWSGIAGDALAAAREGREGPPTQIHVSSSEGELFILEGGSGTVVATADRFALASLVFMDMRALLRNVAGNGRPA